MKRQLVPLLCQNLQLASGFTFLQNANLTIKYMYMRSINVEKLVRSIAAVGMPLFNFPQKNNVHGAIVHSLSFRGLSMHDLGLHGVGVCSVAMRSMTLSSMVVHSVDMPEAVVHKHDFSSALKILIFDDHIRK
jgi:hypothetical protein